MLVMEEQPLGLGDGLGAEQPVHLPSSMQPDPPPYWMQVWQAELHVVHRSAQAIPPPFVTQLQQVLLQSCAHATASNTAHARTGIITVKEKANQSLPELDVKPHLKPRWVRVAANRVNGWKQPSGVVVPW